MKRIVVLTLLIVCLCGFAAAETLSPVGGKYSVNYFAGTENVGKTYIIVAVKGLKAEKISSDGIVYINNATCSEKGYVTLENFATSVPCDCTVFIGGGHLETPVVCGNIVTPVYTGKIVSHGTPNATVKIYAGDLLVETVSTDANGSFTFTDVVYGQNYKLVVQKDGYLDYTLNMTIGDDVTLPDIDIRGLAGDLDGSGKILYNDLLAMISLLGKIGENLPADFDADGTVSVDDLKILIENFNRQDIVKHDETL